jgi:hypothetical protein
MQVKPEAQVRLLDELVPVVERIELDFGKQIGALYNSSVDIQQDGRRLAIRVDNPTNPDGKISADDEWHAYRWNYSATSNPLEYSSNNFTSGIYEILAQGITYFNVTEAQANLNDTALNIEIKTRKNPAAAEDSILNPAVDLTTTIYSRMASGH